MTDSPLQTAAVRLVTLRQASTRLNHPVDYFKLRRARYVDHGVLPFPEPVDDGPPMRFDLVELSTWDQRRLAARGRKGDA